MHNVSKNASNKKPKVHRSADFRKERGKSFRIIRSGESKNVKIKMPGDIEPLRRGNFSK